MTQTQHKTNQDQRYVVAIELGSSQAKIGVAGFTPDDPRHTLTIYNIVKQPIRDIVRYGRISNPREVANVLGTLLENIEKTYPIDNRPILGVYLSLGGISLKSRRISARIVLPERREITEEIIERLQDEAIDNMNTPDQLICVQPVRYNTDNIPTPRPVGMLATRLAGEFTAVVCNAYNRDDLLGVVSDRAGLEVCGITVRPLALAQLVLAPQETNAGCMLVDLGAETTTVAIYRNYALQYLATIPLGSRLITKDIAATMSLTEEDAEDLKTRFANAMPKSDDTPSGIDRDTLNVLNNIVSARLADIIANIAAQPEFAEISTTSLPAGIILTGGGARLRNFARLLEIQTHLKVRIATLPPDIVITDAGLSASDNLDLIALLNDAAEEARANPAVQCIKPRKTTARDDSPADYNDKGILIDLTDKTPVTDAAQENGYDYQPGEFSPWDEEPRQWDDSQDRNPVLDSNDDDDDNPFDLLDSDEEEERRRKQRDYEQRMEEARIRQEERRVQEQRRKDQERRRNLEEKEKEKAKEKKNKSPRRFENLITRFTDFLAGSAEDDSADLD